MNGNYGVTRGIYAKMKVAGFVMWKLVAVALSLVIAFFAMSKIFPNEGIWRYMQLVYVGLTPTWVGYLLMPAVAGKTTLGCLFIALVRKKRFYRSFQK